MTYFEIDRRIISICWQSAAPIPVAVSAYQLLQSSGIPFCAHDEYAETRRQ